MARYIIEVRGDSCIGCPYNQYDDYYMMNICEHPEVGENGRRTSTTVRSEWCPLVPLRFEGSQLVDILKEDLDRANNELDEKRKYLDRALERIEKVKDEVRLAEQAVLTARGW